MIVEVRELKADQIRLNLNLKPETDLVEEIVKTETENSVLLKFKRFKRWAHENIVGLLAVTISIAGIITAAVMSWKSVVKKGGQVLKNFAKSTYNVGKKLGPVFSALGTVLSKLLAFSASTLLWL